MQPEHMSIERNPDLSLDAYAQSLEAVSKKIRKRNSSLLSKWGKVMAYILLETAMARF